jgi:hypothetical protein
MESDKENHPPNQPKPVVTQGDAKLNLKINLCYMKRISELMNKNVSTLNDIFSDPSLADAAKIRKARSTVNLVNRCFGQIDAFQDSVSRSARHLKTGDWITLNTVTDVFPTKPRFDRYGNIP